MNLNKCIVMNRWRWRTSLPNFTAFIGKPTNSFFINIRNCQSILVQGTDFILASMDSVEACFMQAIPSVIVPLWFIFPPSIYWLMNGSIAIHSRGPWTPETFLCYHLCALLALKLFSSTYAPCWRTIVPVVVTNLLLTLISRKLHPLSHSQWNWSSRFWVMVSGDDHLQKTIHFSDMYTFLTWNFLLSFQCIVPIYAQFGWMLIHKHRFSSRSGWISHFENNFNCDGFHLNYFYFHSNCYVTATSFNHCGPRDCGWRA